MKNAGYFGWRWGCCLVRRPDQRYFRIGGNEHGYCHHQDTVVGDILDIAPETAPAFLDIGMHCLGCPASRNETVEEACMVHDQPVEELVERLNDIIKANRKN